MSISWKVITLSLVSLIVTGCVSVDGDVKTYHTYLDPETSEEKDLELRISTPKDDTQTFDDGRRPAIVFVHGGHWERGNFDDAGLNNDMKDANAKGYVAMSINYRLVKEEYLGNTKYPWPSQIQDVKCAVRWLKANIGTGEDQYNINPDKIALVGFSAGGHLALMTGETPNDAFYESNDCPHNTMIDPDTGEEFDIDSTVSAVVSFSGIADMDVYWGDAKTMKDPVRALVNNNDVTQAQLDSINPLLQIDSVGVPVLLMHTKDDDIVPCDGSLNFYQQLMSSSRDGFFKTFPTGGHTLKNIRDDLDDVMHLWLDEKIWGVQLGDSLVQEQEDCTRPVE